LPLFHNIFHERVENFGPQNATIDALRKKPPEIWAARQL